jgi:hypothetical protein
LAAFSVVRTYNLPHGAPALRFQVLDTYAVADRRLRLTDRRSL